MRRIEDSAVEAKVARAWLQLVQDEVKGYENIEKRDQPRSTS